MKQSVTVYEFPYQLTERFYQIHQDTYDKVIKMLSFDDKVARFRVAGVCADYLVFLAYIFSQKKKHRVELLINYDRFKSINGLILISQLHVETFISVYDGNMEPFYIINDGIKYDDNDIKSPHDKVTDLMLDYIYKIIQDTYEDRGCINLLNGYRIKSSKLYIWNKISKHLIETRAEIKYLCDQI